MNKPLKAILLIILTLLIITGCSPSPNQEGTAFGRITGCSTGPGQGAQVGMQAPELQFKNPDGQSISLSDLRGKGVLINFWATWCPPCRNEMPYLQAVYDEWSDRGLVVLAINVGETPSRVEKFMESQRLSLPVLLDTKEAVAEKYNLRGLIPTTFFIDKDGIIQDKIIGAFQNKAQIEKRLSKIMP